MSNRFAIVAALALWLGGASATHPQDASHASGFGEAVNPADENPSAWYLATEKDGIFSARLVKIFPRPDAKPSLDICDKCLGDKKGAKVLGLILYYGLKRDSNFFKNGYLLDPRNGSVSHVWKARISEEAQNCRSFLVATNNAEHFSLLNTLPFAICQTTR